MESLFPSYMLCKVLMLLYMLVKEITFDSLLDPASFFLENEHKVLPTFSLPVTLSLGPASYIRFMGGGC